MSEFTKWRDKQKFLVILQTEAAELAWSHQQARIEELEAAQRWVPVSDPIAPPFGETMLGYHPDWIDEDFNPKGTRECFYCCSTDEPHWFSAKWNDYHDCYDTVEGAPVKWMPITPPETSHE